MKNLQFLALVCTLLMTSCVQETYETTIIFELDMKGTQLDAPGVIGEIPLSWKEALPLTDTNQDSIFTGSVTVDLPWDQLEYKFKSGNVIELYGQENRAIDLMSGDTVVVRERWDVITDTDER